MLLYKKYELLRIRTRRGRFDPGAHDGERTVRLHPIGNKHAIDAYPGTGCNRRAWCIGENRGEFPPRNRRRLLFYSVTLHPCRIAV